MAKRIERSRVDAGRYELPRKLAFLQTDKVDYVGIVDRDGELTVELDPGALSSLVKARGKLKTIKAENKKAAADSAQALEAERMAHEETRAALAKAERRIKALEKKAAAEGTAAPQPKKTQNEQSPAAAVGAGSPMPVPSPKASKLKPPKSPVAKGAHTAAGSDTVSDGAPMAAKLDEGGPAVVNGVTPAGSGSATDGMPARGSVH